jgi:glycosyltransferase involved in cell wall biosynthesis
MSGVKSVELSLPAEEWGEGFAGIEIAVVVPCYNEEASIGKVVRDFRAVLPAATVYVYDNGSSDQTVARALEAGAQVRRENLRGKGNVVRRIFADVDADIYVLVDGDDTYEAAAAPRLIRLLLDGPYDMVTGSRVTDEQEAYRHGHRFGNAVLSRIVATIFGNRVTDMLSGYRILTRRFVKSFPAFSAGFEIETELTVHALDLRMPIEELPTAYTSRPEGSTSKLNTFADGFRILFTILILVKEERPLPFFASIFLFLVLTSLGLAAPIVVEYMETGLVPRFPTAILSTGIMLLGFLSLACGLILDTVTRARREMRRMHYLGTPALPHRLESLQPPGQRIGSGR